MKLPDTNNYITNEKNYLLLKKKLLSTETFVV